ncbi:MAG TPA: PIN domain-containing protein [Caulobacteraceae bacterium]|jgi:predicted nucleic acid-binding protein|nr:PIN domain-containing protein [Caulobacteraceae bacterium]
MTAEKFSLDTNILIYAVDAKAGARHDIAAEVVERALERGCVMTLQALSEFFAVVTRKGLVPKHEAAEMVNDWLLVVPALAPTAPAVRAALAHSIAGCAGYWDALLVETAAEGGCGALISEDLGGRLGGVAIVNPFDGEKISAAAQALLTQEA